MVRKRMNTALDKYVDYAQHISKHQGLIKIERKDTYWVNMENTTCTCEDFKRHGRETPCKHIFLCTIWNNSQNHDE